MRENFAGKSWLLAGLVAGSVFTSGMALAEEGVSATAIHIGTVLDLEGKSKNLGEGLLKGMQAAIKDKVFSDRKLELVSRNDFYTPDKTVEATKELIDEGVFVFAGNVGTPTAKVALPLLAEKGIPAVGFFSGADLLRPGEGDIINFRASYVQEVSAVIQEALSKDVAPDTVCAFVQNDAYGMAGVKGIQAALEGKPGVEATLSALRLILAAADENPDRNGIGPVGLYTRNSFVAREGYDSLKHWEKKRGKPCRLLVTVGSYESVARFIAYAQGKGENWIYSAVSFTGADSLAETLNRFGVTDKVIMTQVVPALDDDKPIVADARAALGKELGSVSLEGYIVGRLLLYGFEQLDANGQPITRANFLAAFRGKQFDLGGLTMDFREDNQGSDFVAMTALSGDRWVSVAGSTWKGWYE